MRRSSQHIFVHAEACQTSLISMSVSTFDARGTSSGGRSSHPEVAIWSPKFSQSLNGFQYLRWVDFRLTNIWLPCFVTCYHLILKFPMWRGMTLGYMEHH